jgi:hypothetical protein
MLRFSPIFDIAQLAVRTCTKLCESVRNCANFLKLYEVVRTVRIVRFAQLLSHKRFTFWVDGAGFLKE